MHATGRATQGERIANAKRRAACRATFCLNPCGPFVAGTPRCSIADNTTADRPVAGLFLRTAKGLQWNIGTSQGVGTNGAAGAQARICCDGDYMYGI
jgi:hypothetical protein